jgi:capsule polysaccharide export protein KpsE/RkpR
MEFTLDPKWDHQLYFILSSPRSGSTVLRNKLNYLTHAVVLPSDTRIVEFIVLNKHLEVHDLKLKFKEYYQQRGF